MSNEVEVEKKHPAILEYLKNGNKSISEIQQIVEQSDLKGEWLYNLLYLSVSDLLSTDEQQRTIFHHCASLGDRSLFEFLLQSTTSKAKEEKQKEESDSLKTILEFKDVKKVIISCEDSYIDF